MGRKGLTADEKRYVKRYEAWEKERWELKGTRTGEMLKLKKDEKFVPVWLPEKRTCYGLYASKYGNIISFRSEIKGVWLEGELEEDGYLKIKGIARSHRIVFYSCWADLIKAMQKKCIEKKEIRQLMVYLSKDKNAKIGDLNELVKYVKKNDLVVHHKNYNKQDNAIENLELLDKETHDALESGNYEKIKMKEFAVLEGERYKVLC